MQHSHSQQVNLEVKLRVALQIILREVKTYSFVHKILPIKIG